MRSITRPANAFETCRSPWRSCCERCRCTSGRNQEGEKHMPQSEKFEVLVLGSGTGGKLIAWQMAQSGRRTAVVERRWVGGSCPNIACMPSKNEIASARIAHLARDGGPYGTVTGSVTGRDREQGRALSVANPSMVASA